MSRIRPIRRKRLLRAAAAVSLLAVSLFILALVQGGRELAKAQSCPAQSSPQFTQAGNVFGRIAAQWNAYFASKVDANGGTLCNPTIVGLPNLSFNNVTLTGVTRISGILNCNTATPLPGALGTDTTGAIFCSSFDLTHNEIYQGNASNIAVAVSVSDAIDNAIGSTRGAILERSVAGWVLVAPGTSGYALVSNGTGADPSYQLVGTAALAQNDVFQGNASNIAIGVTLSTAIDNAIGSTRGALLERGAGGWVLIPPSSTAGLALASNGAGADPSYQTVGTYTAINLAPGTTDIVGTQNPGSQTLPNNGTIYQQAWPLAVTASCTVNLNCSQTAAVTADLSGSTMTVTGVTSGTLHVGDAVSGTGITSGTTISAFGTGTGGTGTYSLSTSATTGTGVSVTAYLTNETGETLICSAAGVTLTMPNPASGTKGNRYEVASDGTNGCSITTVAGTANFVGDKIAGSGVTTYALPAKSDSLFEDTGTTYQTASAGGSSGTVTNVATGTGLTGGPVTTSGTISLATPVSATNGGTGINNGSNTLTLGGAISLPAAPGTTQCLHMSAAGAVTATGSDCGSGSGSVTSVSLGTSGIFTQSGSPITTSGTINLGVTGTSGGIPYFDTTSDLASSGALTAGQAVIGGGAGAAPTPFNAVAHSFSYFGAGGVLQSTTNPTNGQLLIGSTGADPVAASLTPGTDITLTPGAGSLIIGLTSASTTVNGQPCTLGSGCTITASAGTVTVGTTTVASGIDKGLLYDNAGVLGNLATGNNGLLTTNGSGVPSITTAIPNGVTATTQTASDNSTKVATTAYVDAAITASNPAVAVQAATTQASDTSGYSYNNGASGIGATLTGPLNTALTVDGFTFTAIGQRLLVKNDTQTPSGAFNGVYSVTQLQAVGLGLVLTRAIDYDQPSDINNTGAVPVVNGTVNGSTSWLLTSTVTTVGTDPLTYTRFSYPALTLTDGQVAIGSTGNNPVASTLTAGSGISIAQGPGSITITNTGSSGATFTSAMASLTAMTIRGW